MANYKCKNCGEVFAYSEENIEYHTDGESEEWRSIVCPCCKDEILISGYGDFREMQKFDSSNVVDTE